jgi:hypothetical protein
MTVIAEAFSELEWGEPEIAQAQRDLRLAQLEAQGLICRAELLYRVLDWSAGVCSHCRITGSTPSRRLS